jgi:hypothetical protein
MQHPDHGEVLRVGCVCAGNMAEDYIDAKRRETEFIRLQRPDWFRFVPNVVEIRNCTAVAPDDERYPVALANSLARDNPEKFRGLLVCSACDRLQWADRLREWSTIPNVKISAISTSFHGVPEDRAGVHWTVISYNLARKPYLARMISLNRYGLWVFDRVPSFDVRTLGRSPYTITVDRAAGVRIYEMKQPQ